MSSYVEDVLARDERIVHFGRISLWSLSHLILGGVLLLPLFGAGLVLWIIAFVRYRTTELAITNRRVIAKFGFIRRRTVEINIQKVEAIEVDQGILGRLLDFGTLVISGTGTSHAPIVGISAPLAFRRAFVEAQAQA